MSDMTFEQIIAAVQKFSPEEKAQLMSVLSSAKQPAVEQTGDSDVIVDRVWIVTPDNLEKIRELFRPVQEEAEQLGEEVVNQIIAEAIAEVRRERKNRK